MSSHTTAAPKMSDAVTGAAWAMISVTSWRVVNDRPRSPWTIRQTNVPYSSKNDPRRPTESRTVEASPVIPLPRAPIWNASYGIRKKRMYVYIVTTRKSATAHPVRLTMYPSTLSPA